MLNSWDRLPEHVRQSVLMLVRAGILPMDNVASTDADVDAAGGGLMS